MLKDNIIVKKIEKKIDERGYFEVLMDNKIILRDKFGSIIVATVKPDKIRGNHFHKINEDYGCVIEGKALLVYEDVETKERAEVMLDGNDPVLFYVPKDVSHAVKNIGEDLVIFVEYSTLGFEDKVNDIFRHEVI